MRNTNNLLNETANAISKLQEGVDWDYYDNIKFKDVDDKYLPSEGQGETLAEQIVTCVNKLIYRYYNDGDVYDNVNSGLVCFNDLSSYANWLNKYCQPAAKILDGIYNCYSSESVYENILKALADKCLDEDYLVTMEKPAQGDIYNCSGPYEYEEEDDDVEDDEYYY